MKKIGTLFLYVGTVGGLTAAARIPPDYSIFWVCFGILLLGILLRQLFRKGATKLEQSDNLEELREYIKKALREVQSLKASQNVLSTESMHERIDRVVNDFLYNFGQTCSSLKSIFGIKGYNDVMVHFALGERYINRVWSASGDGYLEEAIDYLEKAEPELKQSLAVIDKLYNGQKLK